MPEEDAEQGATDTSDYVDEYIEDQIFILADVPPDTPTPTPPDTPTPTPPDTPTPTPTPTETPTPTPSPTSTIIKRVQDEEEVVEEVGEEDDE